MTQDGVLTPAVLNDFFHSQIKDWNLAAANFLNLDSARQREIAVGRMLWKVQCNPARIRSTGADVSAAAVAKRKCFLCSENRPKEQSALYLKIAGDVELVERSCADYELLVNPFPIFNPHFTVPAIGHVPQQLNSGGRNRFADMLAIAYALPGMAVFYNGATCGASAPDHFHFQIVEARRLPLLAVDEPERIPFKVFAGTFRRKTKALDWFRNTIGELTINGGEEPPVNLLCSFIAGCWKVVIIPRRRHRPSFYGEGEGKMLVSPASIDLAGVLITPAEADFLQIDAEILQALFDECCFSA